MEKNFVYFVWSTPRDDCSGAMLSPKRMKIYASLESAQNFKKEWEEMYKKNCDKNSPTYGKSPCWMNYEPTLDIEAVEVLP